MNEPMTFTDEEKKILDAADDYARSGKLPTDLVLVLTYMILWITRLKVGYAPPLGTNDRVIHFNDAPDANHCRRGTLSADGNGNPFPHEIIRETGVCLWCGAGAKTSVAEVIPADRFETIACPYHGSHKLNVKPDGSYERPDCQVFRPELESS